jgi:MFS family permease
VATGGASKPARPRLVSGGLVRVFLAGLGGMSSFSLLLPVMPLYATAAGAGEIGAGSTTAALLLATVAAELVTPRLVNRFGNRLVYGIGLLLLGLPVLVLTVWAHLGTIIAVSAVRGLGFGIVVVQGSALVAGMVPASRRGEGLGVYGVAIGVPGVLVLPFGVFLLGQVGFPPVLVAGAVVAMVGLVGVAGLPSRGSAATPPPRSLPGRGPAGGAAGGPAAQPAGIGAALRTPDLIRPAAVFGTAAMAAGVIVTFLPMAVAGTSAYLGALGLFVQASTAVVARLWAGRYGDRHDPAKLVIPALLTAAAGVLALVLLASPVAVVVGMALFGAGFGVSQNASLVLMFNRVSSSRYGTVSAMWNLAFDGGMGLGAISFGVLAARAGFPVAFAVLGAVLLLAVVPALRDRHDRRDLGH